MGIIATQPGNAIDSLIKVAERKIKAIPLKPTRFDTKTLLVTFEILLKKRRSEWINNDKTEPAINSNAREKIE